MIKGRSFVGSRGDNSYSSNQSTSKSNNQSMTQREDNSYIHDHMDNISRNQRLKQNVLDSMKLNGIFCKPLFKGIPLSSFIFSEKSLCDIF
jgi:hypothetical protein